MADTDVTPISPVGVSKPEISVSAPAINNEPVELDSTPTSPEELRKRRGSKEEILTPEEREKREQLIKERKGDAAVLADIPQTPGAAEFEKSKDAEGKVSNEGEGSKAVGSS